MTRTFLLTALLAASGCSIGTLGPDVVSAPGTARATDDLDALADRMNDERHHVRQQAAAHEADGLAPFVRFVPAGSDLADPLAEAFCDATADPDACFGALDRHTEAAQRLDYDVRAVAVVAIPYERAFGDLGPGKCPPPPDDRPSEFEPGPSPPLDRWTTVVAERVLDGEAVSVVEIYAFTGDAPAPVRRPGTGGRGPSGQRRGPSAARTGAVRPSGG